MRSHCLGVRRANVREQKHLVLSVRELSGLFSKSKLMNALSKFKCSRDQSIERFVRTESLEFAEDMYGTTYVIVEERSWLAGRLTIQGIFTLAIATADFSGLSKSQHKKIFGHKTRGKIGPHRGAWLLGQFARSDDVDSDELPGREMYSCVLEKLRSLREASSGRVLILECVPQLQRVYESYDFKMLPPPDDTPQRLVTMYTIPEPKRSPLYPPCAQITSCGQE